MANQSLVDRQRAGAAGGILMAGSPFLGLLPPELAGRPKDAFFLEQEWTPLASLASATRVEQITAEASLLLLGAAAEVRDTTDQTLVTNFPALVKITDGSQRVLMNAPVPFGNLFGTAQLMAIWVWPKFIAANSQLTTTLQSLDSTNARNVRVTFWGFKIY